MLWPPHLVLHNLPEMSLGVVLAGVLIVGALVTGLAAIVRLAEEAPDAYKDVDRVVEVCHQAGLCKKVARLRPLAVVKG